MESVAGSPWNGWPNGRGIRIKQTVLESTAEAFRYETPLWTCALLAEVLLDRFGVEVGGEAVNQHRQRLGLSPQKPSYHAVEPDPLAVEHFVKEEFPKLQRFAETTGADIGFEDEAAVDLPSLEKGPHLCLSVPTSHPC
ncbi:winged helix-turn-helix domain-containing protein [Thiocapsa sp.]|uniref:helix-turn-helix domain-containing protein n=1 Tax=Thiocapsa sp. TaxID=2024551 RepID=UPI0035936CEE